MNTHSVFRILHIVGGVLWVGAAVFTAAFLIPAARAIGPAAGPIMRELTVIRKLPIYLLTVAWVTLLSGGVLMYRDMGNMGVRWFEQGSGLAFGVGAFFAIVGAAIGMTVSTPTVKKVGAISATLQKEGRAPSAAEGAQLQALQDRLFTASRIVAVLLLMATGAMAYARYM